MATPTRRSRNDLSGALKKEICLYKLENPRVTLEQLANFVLEKYGQKIGKSTVFDILRTKDVWLNIDSETGLMKRLRVSKSAELDEALYKRYVHIVSTVNNAFVTKEMIITEAQQLGHTIGLPPDFVFSDRWFAAFRKKYGIVLGKANIEGASSKDTWEDNIEIKVENPADDKPEFEGSTINPSEFCETPLEEGAESTSGVEGGPSSAASFLQSLDLYQQGSSNEHMGGQSEEWAVPQPLPMQQSQQSQPVVAKPKPTPPPALQPAPPPPPPPPPEVCLRWNSYQSNIQSVFPNLLSKEQFVDVTLACEGKSIKCHKVMLSACSTYFEELLSENPCQHPIVLMKDLKFWEVEALVNFMYHGEVNVGQDKLPSLLVAAEALQIKGLASPSSSSQEDSNQEASSVETSRQSIGEEELRAKRGRKRRAVPEAPSVVQANPPPVRPAVPQRPRPVTNTSSAYQSPKTVPSEPKQKRSSLPVVTNVQSIKVEPIEIVDDDEDSRPAEPVATFTEPFKETGESSKQPDSGGTDKGGSTDGTDTGNDEGQGTGYGMELTSDTVAMDQKSDFGQFQSDSSVSQGYSDDAESADVDCKTSINTV